MIGASRPPQIFNLEIREFIIGDFNLYDEYIIKKDKSQFYTLIITGKTIGLLLVF